MKLLQNKTFYLFTSIHHSDAMPHFSKYLFYCIFNAHNKVLLHNPGLIIPFGITFKKQAEPTHL